MTERGRRNRRPSGDDRERAILETAEQLLQERALREISVDDLARGAGISRPTFYFYFPSKESVVLSLLDRVVEEARTSITDAIEQAADDPPLLWRQALSAIVETFGSHRAVTVAGAQLFAENDQARKLWAGIMEGFVEDTTAVIELERARGAAPDGIPACDLAIALNWMNERVLLATFAGQEPRLDEEDILDVLLAIWGRAIYRSDHLGG